MPEIPPLVTGKNVPANSFGLGVVDARSCPFGIWRLRYAGLNGAAYVY